MKKFLLLIAAVLALASMMMSCSGTKTGEATDENVLAPLPDSVYVQKLENDSLLRPDTKVERLTVLDFNAVWCGPCQLLKPSFHAAADSLHGKVDFYSVDIDSMRATADAFKIQAVPTIVILSPADTVRTYLGLDPYIKGFDPDTIQTIEQFGSYITPQLIKIIEE